MFGAMDEIRAEKLLLRAEDDISDGAQRLAQQIELIRELAALGVDVDRYRVLLERAGHIQQSRIARRDHLRRELDHYFAIIDSAEDAIISKTLDGVIRSWNPAAERMFGYTAEEAIGKPITLIIPEGRLAEEPVILDRIHRGERMEQFETVRQRKDGSCVEVSLTISPILDSEGRIVGASKIARDISEQKRNQEHIRVLAREAEHRSKNLLANVAAIVNLSRSDTPEGLKDAITGRIRALSNVHSLFVESRWSGAELLAIARQELAPYLGEEGGRVRIEGREALLEPSAAQALAVVLHELATNATKYGALSDATGAIALTWSRDADGKLLLRWTETGGPPVQKPERQGFGSRLIERTIGQLNGTARFDWRPEGLVCEITLPT